MSYAQQYSHAHMYIETKFQSFLASLCYTFYATTRWGNTKRFEIRLDCLTQAELWILSPITYTEIVFGRGGGTITASKNQGLSM